MVQKQQEEKLARREDDVELKAPFGWSLRASGRHTASLVVGIAVVFAILYFLREHDLKQTADLQAAVKERNGQMAAVMNSQDKIQDSLDSMIYVLSLEPDERKKLKIAMPPAMRNRLLNQERP